MFDMVSLLIGEEGQRRIFRRNRKLPMLTRDAFFGRYEIAI